MLWGCYGFNSALAPAVRPTSERPRFEKNYAIYSCSAILSNRKGGIGNDNSAQTHAGAAEHGCVVVHRCGRAGSGAILTARWGFDAGAADDPRAGDVAARHGRSLLRRRAA